MSSRRSFSDIKCKPFLKLIDFKFPFLPKLFEYIPNNYNRYIEPFLGTGSLFLALEPEDAIISDIHRELVLCWRTVRDKPDEVVKEFKKHVPSREYFNILRGMNVSALSYAARAARVIYLTQAARTHAYCETRNGNFALDFGPDNTKLVLNAQNLNRVAEALSRDGVRILHNSFEMVQEHAEENDFVYLDPPHLPLGKPIYSATTRDRFTYRDYKILTRVMRNLHEVGAKVLLTTNDRPELRKLFENSPFDIDVGEVKKRVRDGAEVKVVTLNELVIFNYSL